MAGTPFRISNLGRPAGGHLDVELVGRIRNELTPSDRQRADAHLAECAECRRMEAIYSVVLADLRANPPPPPDWRPWQAELRVRLRTARPAPPPWRRRPVVLALASAAAVALIALALPFGRAITEHPVKPDVAAVDEVAVGQRLDDLNEYPEVERLTLLEDLDVISHLDRLQRESDR